MPDFLLDTNAIAASMKGEAAFESYLLSRSDEGMFNTSAIVEGELRFGLERMPSGRKKKSLANALTLVLKQLYEVLPITRKVSRRYALLKNERWKQGKPMGENDLWIAATALANNLVLVTRDEDFQNIHGLPVEDWNAH